MKTILFFILFTAISVKADFLSTLPVTAAIGSNDAIVINVTNSASSTHFTSKTISFQNFYSSIPAVPLNSTNVIPLNSFFYNYPNGQAPAPMFGPFVPLISFGHDFSIPNYVTNLTLNLKLWWPAALSQSITCNASCYYAGNSSSSSFRTSPANSSSVLTVVAGEQWIRFPFVFSWPDTNATKWANISGTALPGSFGATNLWIESAYYTTSNNVFRGTNF